MIDLTGFEAIIFDMDGTLVDSMGIWGQIDVEFLGERGIPMPHDLQRQIEGMSFLETANFFKEHFGLTESLEEIKQIWNDMALRKYSNGMQLKPGVREFLEYAKKLHIPMGIATSNSTFLTNACLESLGIDEYFDAIVTGTDVTKGKPQPDVYLEAARRLKANPNKCLVFEDVPKGLMAAKNAGMTACAIYDDFSAVVDEEKKQLADYYIFDYKEVIQ